MGKKVKKIISLNVSLRQRFSNVTAFDDDGYEYIYIFIKLH